MEKEEVIKRLEDHPCRSAWQRGVVRYAMELLDNLNDEITGSPADKKMILNGSEDWYSYSYDAKSLIYDRDVAERLCNKTELKRTNYGAWNPSADEQWLDLQAVALSQASKLIFTIVKGGR